MHQSIASMNERERGICDMRKNVTVYGVVAARGIQTKPRTESNPHSALAYSEGPTLHNARRYYGIEPTGSPSWLYKGMQPSLLNPTSSSAVFGRRRRGNSTSHSVRACIRVAILKRGGGLFTRRRVSCCVNLRCCKSTMGVPALVPLSQISPWLVAILLVVFSTGLWLLSYIFEWMQKLDHGVGHTVQHNTGCFYFEQVADYYGHLFFSTATTAFLEDPTSLEKVRCPSLFGPPEKYMSLVMPAYNEEERLPASLDETLRYLQGRAGVDKNFTYEIIIVDDGSKDNTVKVAFDYVRKFKMDNVRVIKQGVNCGKGAAVVKGVMCSRGELILMLDADGATKITDLERLESAILKFAEKTQKQKPGGMSIADSPVVACGSRAHLEKQALATRKWYRNVLMKCFHYCVVVAAGSGVRDTQCGFKMFTRDAARQLFLNVRLKRWCFDVELLYLCRRLRIPTMEVAVNWTEIPGSKVRITSIVHMLFELVLIRLGYGFNIWKIHQNLIHSRS